MVANIIDAEEANKALALIKSIKEVPNPAYKKAMRDRKAFSPQPGSIHVSDKPIQPSLAVQMQQREKRYTLEILTKVCDICEYCPECENCAWSCEVKAIDRCERVKRNLVYIGVIER